MEKKVPFLLLFVLAGAVLFQCSKEEEPISEEDKQEVILACDPSGFVSPPTTFCDPDQYLPPDLFCEYEYLGKRELLPPTRHQIKYLCPEVRQVNFTNTAGKIITLSVEKTTGFFDTQMNGDCPDVDERETLICSESEAAWVVMRNRTVGLEFHLYMQIDERDPVHPAQNSDRVGISLQRVEGEQPYSWPFISYLVEPDGFRRLMTPGTYLADHLKLGGKEYLDVIYRRPIEADPSMLEVYFNTDIGIIAWRDREGETWIFKSFN
jgi:hypothetical protein